MSESDYKIRPPRRRQAPVYTASGHDQKTMLALNNFLYQHTGIPMDALEFHGTAEFHEAHLVLDQEEGLLLGQEEFLLPGQAKRSSALVQPLRILEELWAAE